MKRKHGGISEVKISVWRSIGTRLFLYVLSGAMVGLGGMSYLFYQIFENQAVTEIRSHLNTQAVSIEGQLSRSEQAATDAVAAVKAMHMAGIQDPEVYKQLALNFYLNRTPIMTGIGFGQAPAQLVPDRRLFLPYFFVDQHTPDQVGEVLPAPYADTRYLDIGMLEDYTQQNYYRSCTEARKSLWLEPYRWQGITITSFMFPIYINDGKQLLGTAGFDSSVTSLSQQVNDISVIQNSGYFAVLSQQGKLLVYPPNPQKAETLAAYKDIPELQSVWLQVGENQTGLIKAEGMYWAYQRIKGTNWLMLAVVPQSVVLKPVLLITVGSALGAGVILALVVSLFVRRLNQRLKPILHECDKLVETDMQRVQRLKLQNPEDTSASAQLELNLHRSDELDILDLSFRHMTSQLQASFDELEQRVDERTEELTNTLQHLKQSQLRLVQSEKMSSLGQLVAGVAHEINNPVNFIHGNLSYINSYTRDLLNLIHLYDKHLPAPPPEIQETIAAIELDFLEEDLAKVLQSMRMGTDRIRDIVRSLRNFSRLDEAEVKDIDIHEGIDSTLIILQNRFKARFDRPEIQIIKQYGPLPLIECYAGQLNQVFMNILSNSVDALDERDTKRTAEEMKANPSKIWIATENIGKARIAIHISDNGPGISEAVQSYIFDPFFTTKSVGKGTGLGLSISYQIVTERHNGKLGCESTVEQGTRFSIEIPIRQTTSTAA